MPLHDNGYGIIAVRNAAGAAYHDFLYLPPRLAELPPGSITTVAGVGDYDHAYGRATEAMITANSGCVFDRSGNAYIADPNGNRIYVVRTDGTIERFAGNGSPSDGVAGEGRDALDVAIGFPRNVATDGLGNVYIPDAGYRIRKVGADGVLHDFAGTGKKGFAGEGVPAAGNSIGYPSWLVADANDLFFLEDQVRVRRIHLADGIVTTFAGDGTPGFSGDGGPATQARFRQPTDDNGGLALDAQGNVFLLDSGNGRIRKIDRKSGIIDTAFALTDGKGNPVDLWALAVDRDGNIVYSPGRYIAKVTPDGKLLEQYGKTDGLPGFSEDGTPAISASFGQIYFLGFDPSGNLVFSDSSVGTTRRINATTGRLETIAGMRPAIYAENGPATSAIFNLSNGGDIDFAPNGDLLIADTGNYRIRRLDATGNLTTIAGNGMLDGGEEGSIATKTGIYPMTVHAYGGGIDVTIAGRLRRLDAAGVFHAVTNFKAGGTCQYNGDNGPAINAGVCQPWDTARDRDGNLFFADTNNNRIRRIDAATGVITTVAGNGNPPNGGEAYGRGKECGDGGPALDACLNTPYGLVFDAEGNLFVADNFFVLRRIDVNGIISTVSRAPFTKLRTDASGSIFGAGYDYVGRIDRQGQLTVLAGGNGFGFSGDGGSARAAKVFGFGQSQGVAIDGEGNLFFVDAGNHRVRAIRYGAVLAPPDATISVTVDGAAIRATVLSSNARPAPSVRVDFAAPESGATCALSSPFAITDANGTATVSCAPNCVGGTYSVSARLLAGAGVATVSLTNVSAPCRRRSVRH